jgi:hypothetical protein
MNPRLLRPTSSTLDADAAVYLNAVAQADGQQLEPAVRKAINDFVVGCKRDNIWNAIKASCILAGARTLTGALIPLKGAAPTNNGPFVSGDYNRETGLLGNGTSKYLDSNRNCNADPQDNFHMAVFSPEAIASGSIAFGAGGAGTGATQCTTSQWRSRNGTADNFLATGTQSGLFGLSRSASTEFVGRNNQTSTTFSRTSQTPFNGNLFVYARNSSGAGIFVSSRLAFYSIGESLNLALLESRISTLITAIGNAIP